MAVLFIDERSTKLTDAIFPEGITDHVEAGHHHWKHTKKWAAKIASFDGYIVVTLEYNHGTSGEQKNAIDFIYAEWNNKAAGFVCYPQLSTVYTDTDSVMPYFWGDIVHESPNANPYVPPIANHNYGVGTAKGSNLLYLDGHIKWNKLAAGSSWRIGTSAYTTHWMNDPAYPPPTGALINNP